MNHMRVLPRVLRSIVSSRQSVAEAAVYLTAFTLLSKALSAVQQILIGRTFGATAETDAFSIAQIVPLLMGGMIAMALTTSLIPVLANRQAFRPGALSGVLLTLTGMLLAMSLVCWTFQSTIVRVLGHGLDQQTASIASRLVKLMSSLILVMGLGGVLTAFFYANSRFLLPAITSSLLYVGGIAGILLKPLLGIDGLAWGLLVGSALQLLVLGLSVDKSWFQSPVFEPGVVWGLLRSFVPVFLGLAISTFYLIIDRSFATPFPSGYVASYNFAGNLMTLPLQMIVGNIANALLPSLVALKTRRAEFADMWGKALAWVSFALAPAIVIMLTWSRPLVRLLFHSEVFGLEAVSFTGGILAAYSLAILGLAMKDISTVALIALGKERVPMLIGMGGLLLSVLLKVVLMPRWGHMAIAYTTDLASILNGLILLALLSWLLPLNWRRIVHPSGWKVLVAGLAMVVCWLLFRRVASVDEGLTGWLYVPVVGAVYLLACAALRVPEWRALLARARLRLAWVQPRAKV
jgi:putative peptidoglycan lipid II flippase